MLKNCLRTICMLLIVTLLVNMLPMGVFAQAFQEQLSATEEVEAVDTVETAEAEEAYIVKEITENRTEFSKEFQLSNGLRMAAVYADAVHYETDNGWEEIDNTLTAQTDGTYANTAGVWDVRFPSQLTKNKGITIEKDGYTLSFYMAGELKSDHALMSAADAAVSFALTPEISTEELTVAEMQLSTAAVQPIDFTAQKQSVEYPEIIPEKASSRLRYENIYQNTNVVYDLNGNQVKESIILSGYNSALRGYRYALDVGTMRPVLNEDGSIYFYNADQTQIVMVMPAPYLVDANQDYCDDITVSLTGQGSTYTMTYQLPAAWLAADDRAWPVVLDPAVMPALTTTNIRDRTVASEKTYAQNWGMNSCGYGTGVGISRFYLKYNALPSITSSDVIIAAYISMVSTADSTGKQMVVEAHKVNAAWESETITWSNKPGYNTNVEDYTIVNSSAVHTWNITDIARDWYATGNNGVMFKMPDTIESSTTDNYKQFVSSDYTENDVYQPILTICFRNNNGLEGYWDYTASSAGRAGTGYINNFTGNLVLVREDLSIGGNRMPVSISHVYNANDSSNNEFGLGNGWRTNFNQKVYLWSTDNSYYVWEDADGTRHYFKYSSANTYKDEDSLEMTLTVDSSSTEKYCITDKNGNCSYFDTYGRLVRMTNNQQTKSSITLTYTTTSGMMISSITDGAGRGYRYFYSNGLMSHMVYRGKGTVNLSHVVCTYDGTQLITLTDTDGAQSSYSYTNGLLSSVADSDGYKLTYTYYPVTDATWQPYRVKSVSESDGAAQGGSLTMAYAHNQTTFTDHNGNVEIHQFNDFGNTLCIQDDEGHAQYTQFALNTDEEAENNTDATKKGNQLRLSSKLQNTVGNRLPSGSFEDENCASNWSLNKNAASYSRTTEQHYLGNASLKFDCSNVTSDVYLLGPSFQVQPGQTYTFSAYVKTGSADVYIGMTNTSTWATTPGEILDANKDWTRIQAHYTNDTEAVVTMRPCFFSGQQGVIYIDCAQVEKAATASRYNLVENGDFIYSTAWTMNTNTRVTETSPAAQLDNTVCCMVGAPTNWRSVYQYISVSGNAGDTYVLAGWAKGDSAPLTSEETDTNIRRFCLKAIFHNTDGTTTERLVSFNPDCPGRWQYAATAAIADKAYTKIQVAAVYDYNVNTVYFDGIQLYKEEFGNSYTYDSKGNVISVTDLQKQTTTYEYDTNSNLTQIIQDNKAKMTYDYDDYHNVQKATTQEGLSYSFTYDTYGNNLSVSISKDGSTMSSSATYSNDGNRLESTTDALGQVTTYSYNEVTNVLEWVQYPNDTDGTEDADDPKDTRTNYTYDSMYRMASAACTTDKGNSLSAEYTYTNDLLATIETPSTTYNFTYGDFGLRTGVSAGTNTLATYEYTDDANRYLSKLDYGNQGSVEYTYDDKGRLLTQTYEDGDKVTYTYDNNGALATMVDHTTGITTTYYYDLSNRMVKYAENGANYSHGVEYTYDEKNNLTKLEETIGGVDHTTDYSYDDDNRIETVTANGTTITYTYDDFGRVTQKVTTNSEGTLRTESYTYVVPESGKTSTQVATHTIVTGNTTQTYTYTYDGNGNITSIFDGSNTTTYAYDSANQLIRENNQAGNYTYTWTYDNTGNILSKNAYTYTTGELNTSPYTVDYTYGNSEWGDLLTRYNGAIYKYDSVGNLVREGALTYTWEHGRQLASISYGSDSCNFSYNADGLRTQRTDGDTTYNYIYNGSQLTQMTVDGYTLSFFYDAEGKPASFTYYDGTDTNTYYYATNLQGDVTGIFNEDGTHVVNYTYDAWGNALPITGSMAASLGRQNPLRYRGYVYDYETGLYYLQSRYYNPRIGRFINADTFAATGQSFTGNNMFAYCGNNPVARIEVGGYCWELVAAGAIASLVSGISNAINTAYSGGDVQDCLLAGLAGMVGGAVGFVVAVATNFSPLGNVAARAATTIVSDLGTNLAHNGKITWTDVSFAAVDATIDVCISPVAYYYNPIEALIPQTAVNAMLDGAIDFAETALLYTPRPTSAKNRSVQKLTFMERRLT